METRAHFVLIGLFTLLGILGGLGFFVWLASVQIDRQYARYGILFNEVSGLDQSADVLFNGVNVGRVTEIRIWEDDPSQVYVAVEIDATTPIRTDTVAQLESQGVTGVAYIALSGGAAGAQDLPRDGLSIISSRPSTLQSLVSGAPDLLDDAARILSQLERLASDENIAYIETILSNVDAATAELDTALTDFSDITATIEEATSQIGVFTDGLDELRGAAQNTLAATDETLTAVTRTFNEAETVLQDMGPAITAAQDAFAAIGTFVTDELTPLSPQLATTLENTDAALAAASAAMSEAETMFGTDLAPAIADFRTAAANFGDTMTAISADVPAITSDLRGVASDIRAAVAAATPGLRDFGQLGGEARALVNALSDLLRQITRDPARFFLQDRVPDYRR